MCCMFVTQNLKIINEFSHAGFQLHLHGKNVFGYVVLCSSSWLLDHLKLGQVFVCCTECVNGPLLLCYSVCICCLLCAW